MNYQKLICVCSVALLPAFFVSAQKGKGGGMKQGKEFSVTWGPDIKMKGEIPADILLFDKGNFYVENVTLREFSQPDIILAKINERLDLVAQNRIDTEKKDSKASYNHGMCLAEFNGEMFVLEEEKVHKDGMIYYYAEGIDKTTLKPNQNKRLLYSINYGSDNDRANDKISIATDDDRKKFFAVIDQHSDGRRESTTATITVLDSSFGKLWEKTVTLPVAASEKQDEFSWYVDKDANFYILAKVYGKVRKNSKDVKDGLLNYDYHIYMMGNKIKTFIDFPFSLQDRSVMQVKLNVKSSGDLIATGIYSNIISEKDKVSIPRGIFYTTMDVSAKTIKSQSYKEFPMEVYVTGLKQSKAEREEKKVEGEKHLSYTFLIQTLLNREDGGCTMVAEQYSAYQVATVGRFAGMSVKMKYNYMNIVLAKISPAGELEWVSVIPKDQLFDFEEKILASFLIFENGHDSYHLFFNDSRDNLPENLKPGAAIKTLNSHRELTLVSVPVDPNGVVGKRTEVLELPPDDEHTRFYPMLSFIAAKGKDIILYGTESAHDKFAKIHFVE